MVMYGQKQDNNRATLLVFIFDPPLGGKGDHRSIDRIGLQFLQDLPRIVMIKAHRRKPSPNSQ